ncbi:hypothetical protein FQN60_009902, partial [Etheostoma spectabile]
MVNTLLEEKKSFSEKGQAEMKELRETNEKQSKTIKSLRDGGAGMLVKQKEANRQSMLLLQSAEPSVQLLKALEDVAAVTKTLEEELQELQESQEKASVAPSTEPPPPEPG